MIDKEGTWIIVPAFNEATDDAVGNTVRDLRRYFKHVVVVDDCSTDQTSDFAFNAGAHICRHPLNLGQGAALATGLQYALANGAQTLATFDADGQHRVEDVIAMIETLRERNVDVVLGSRFAGKTIGMPQGRRVLLRIATLFTRATTGLRVTDAHNGLRVLSSDAARKITIRQNRMAHASEFLTRIAQLRLKYCEHPVTIVYTEATLKKGQRMTGAFAIVLDLAMGKLYK